MLPTLVLTSLMGLAAASVAAAPDEPTSPYEPTSSKAPESADDVPAAEPAAEPASDTSHLVSDEAGEVEESSLEQERVHARTRDFNRHGVGVRGGIVVIPTWILSRYLDAHANALCRGDSIGNFAADRGLLKTKGCNFYVGGEYTYRQSRILDIVAAVGYQHLHTPDGYWLDKGQAAVNGVGGADYTEIKMGIVFMQADFIARAPIVVRDSVELGIGGGGGLGLGIVTGGIWQTALGDAPRGYSNGTVHQNSCQKVGDLADFTRCTPRWDPTEAGAVDNLDTTQLSHPNADGYANCSRDRCNTGDLNKFGYRRKQSEVPPVIPIVNLVISARIIIKDVFGITLNGGWNTGFYFGGGLTYFFGKEFQKQGRSGPAPSK